MKKEGVRRGGRRGERDARLEGEEEVEAPHWWRRSTMKAGAQRGVLPAWDPGECQGASGGMNRHWDRKKLAERQQQLPWIFRLRERKRAVTLQVTGALGTRDQGTRGCRMGE